MSFKPRRCHMRKIGTKFWGGEKGTKFPNSPVLCAFKVVCLAKLEEICFLTIELLCSQCPDERRELLLLKKVGQCQMREWFCCQELLPQGRNDIFVQVIRIYPFREHKKEKKKEVLKIFCLRSTYFYCFL